MENIISDKAIEEVMTRLDVLATKLGVTAEYLFGVYVKQAHIVLFNNILWYLFVCVFLTSLGLWLKYNLKHMTVKRLDDCNPRAIACLVLLVITGTTVIGTFIGVASSLQNTLTCYYNPEYFAFTKILRHIK